MHVPEDRTGGTETKFRDRREFSVLTPITEARRAPPLGEAVSSAELLLAWAAGRSRWLHSLSPLSLPWPPEQSGIMRSRAEGRSLLMLCIMRSGRRREGTAFKQSLMRNLPHAASRLQTGANCLLLLPHLSAEQQEGTSCLSSESLPPFQVSVGTEHWERWGA